MKCDNCEHFEVCGKKVAYKAIFDNLSKDTGEFEVELRCKHWREVLAVENLKKYLEQQKIIIGSPSYTKPYIGDVIPNPWEITCK